MNNNGLIMKYFVLKPAGTSPHAAASRRAMRVYADEISDTLPELALDLREWADREGHNALKGEKE